MTNLNAASWYQVIQGGALAQVYEYQAEECLRSAAKAYDPKQRALMLKLAVRSERMQKH